MGGQTEMGFPYEAVMEGRKYRFTIDESRGHPTAKVSAEFYHEPSGEWRSVVNWNTRELLYRRVEAERHMQQKIEDIMLCDDIETLKSRRWNMELCLMYPSGFDIVNISRWIEAIDKRLEELGAKE